LFTPPNARTPADASLLRASTVRLDQRINMHLAQREQGKLLVWLAAQSAPIR